MPKLDPAFQAFMHCSNDAAVSRWLESEIDHYIENDPLKEKRVYPMKREEARRAVIGHLAFNAGYCGKDVVDRVHRYFGDEAFSFGAMPSIGTRPRPPERTFLDKVEVALRRLRAWIGRKL